MTFRAKAIVRALGLALPAFRRAHVMGCGPVSHPSHPLGRAVAGRWRSRYAGAHHRRLAWKSPRSAGHDRQPDRSHRRAGRRRRCQVQTGRLYLALRVTQRAGYRAGHRHEGQLRCGRRDFAPITQFLRRPAVLVVNPVAQCAHRRRAGGARQGEGRQRELWNAGRSALQSLRWGSVQSQGRHQGDCGAIQGRSAHDYRSHRRASGLWLWLRDDRRPYRQGRALACAGDNRRCAIPTIARCAHLHRTRHARSGNDHLDRHGRPGRFAARYRSSDCKAN